MNNTSHLCAPTFQPPSLNLNRKINPVKIRRKTFEHVVRAYISIGTYTRRVEKSARTNTVQENARRCGLARMARRRTRSGLFDDARALTYGTATACSDNPRRCIPRLDTRQRVYTWHSPGGSPFCTAANNENAKLDMAWYLNRTCYPNQ